VSEPKQKRWALIGHWHGSPCLVRRDYIPPFVSWFRITERQYRENKRDGFLVLRSLDRPEKYLSDQDKIDQRNMPEFYER
jgi:hypothetical protein